MAEYLSPGVYVEEFDSGSKPMEGVGTSTAGFVGLAERGPVSGVPQLATNFADFKRTYGGYLSENEFGEYRFLAYAVEQFFLNGGARCFISRVAPSDAKCSKGSVPKEKPVLQIVSKKTAKSDLAEISYTGSQTAEAAAPFDEIAAGSTEEKVQVSLTGGSNGSVTNISAADFIGVDNGAGNRTGIQSFVDNDVVSIMAVPGVTDPNVQLTLVAHCENLASRFAVLDMPRDARKVQDVSNHREIVDSTYAAMYHPWLQVFDPLDKKNIMIPPSGSVIGIYARSDNSRGVHKAPANEVVRGCVGLDCQFNKGEQDILNPKGVNLIRVFPGRGIRVWGARTTSSDGSWKYINVRRLFIYIEESIKANTNWAVFEPNDEVLWVRVQRTISVFLNNMWRDGSLAGSSPEEAFFVNIGRDTMSQDDIDNGRLICVIGVAPVKPAEFVIFRITQKTNTAE